VLSRELGTQVGSGAAARLELLAAVELLLFGI
jgi:hypothetical protein